MNDRDLVLLKLLEAELTKTVLPAAGNEMSRQITTVSKRLLSRWLVEETQLPQFRVDAIKALSALLPMLQGQVHTDLYQQFEQCLAPAAAENWPRIDTLLEKIVVALLANDNVASRQLASQLIGIDSRLRELQENACQDRINAEHSDENPFDLGGLNDKQQSRLLDFIKECFPEEKNVRIAGITPITGGFSKQTIFIDLTGNVTLPAKIVMRRDAPYKTVGTSVTMEFPVIEKMYAGGVPVAQPLALEASGEVLGNPFMLLSSVTGRNVGDYLFVNEKNPALASDLAQQIARIHTIPISGLESVLNGGKVSPRERMLAEIEGQIADWNALTHYRSYTVQAALDWLRRNVDLADGPRVVVHRDIGMHNMVVQGDRIAGIFDWETCVIGARAEDIAYTYHMVCQLGDWDSFVTAYERAAGVTLDRRQLDYYIIGGAIRIAVGIARVGDAVINGHLGNIQFLYIGEYFTKMLIQRIAAKLSEVLA